MAAEIDALDRLHKFVEKYRTQQEAAKSLGISAAYLSDMVNMRRDISPSILSKLGLKRAVVSK